MPVLDGAATLRVALESALGQTHGDIEVVLVDDGSSDSSLEIARRLARSDPRLRVFARPHGGLVEALNAGLEVCRGDFVARLDADDVAMPTRIARQLACFEADSALSVVDAQVRFVRSEGAVPGGMQRYAESINRCLEPEDFARLRFLESMVVHPAATLRRAALESVGGYRCNGPEDFDLWLRLHERGHRFRKVPEVLVRMCDHDARATRRDPRYARSEFRRVAAEALLRGPLQRSSRVVLWGAGVGGRSWLRFLRSCDRTPIAILDVDPQKFGSMRGGDVEVLPHEAISTLDVDLCLIAVGVHNVHDEIREFLARARPAWSEGAEYWFLVT